MRIDAQDIEAIAKRVAELLGTPSDSRRWLTVDEALRYSGIKSRTTLMKWVNEGYIDASKRTGQWIIDKQSIDDWYRGRS
jgi:hypothetical protein